ncbi:unnamed protein product [Meloidogyne enterolobii]|uniref:Uncharacterized protein n=1 Tax=Meloidogyne enterolobii TaxID=390850 RepID=A0ACB1AR64_MELEN
MKINMAYYHSSNQTSLKLIVMEKQKRKMKLRKNWVFWSMNIRVKFIYFLK